MKELWSKNKYINLSVNILIFLVAINFMHIGQLLLPIICLLLFIDNKFRFKVNDLFSFIVLCLFAITFFAFSYKLGFYSVMGFTLPMAYYIGSNMFKPNKEKVKNLIYLIAFGMASHLIINFIFELIILNFNVYCLFTKESHYDLWVYIIRGGWKIVDDTYKTLQVKPNSTSLNYVFLTSSIYYIVKHEDKKCLKITGIILYIISSIYCIALARRTSLVIFALSILIPIFYSRFVLKTNKKTNRKRTLLILLMFVIFCMLYLLNICNIKNQINNITIIRKIINKGLNSGRIEILIESLKLYPKYLFGGQKISSIVGFQPHDLWGDIYDYAGIFPYLLLISFSIKILYFNIKFFIKNANKQDNILFLSWFLCTSIVLFVEPMMTGSSLYLILYVIIITVLESLHPIY